MLTVKVHIEEEYGIVRKTIAACSIEANYYDDGLQFVEIKDYRGDMYTFSVDENTKVYVENLSGKTVDVYKVAHA